VPPPSLGAGVVAGHDRVGHQPAGQQLEDQAHPGALGPADRERREVSRLSGVRVNRIRFGSFVAAGALSGVGAVIAVAALGGYNPTTSDSYLLPVFAAVFLGTAIIEPGRFNPIGTFIGIYFLETGILGLQLLGLQAWVSPVFYGGVLVVAVTISTLLRRRTT
jgi:ribose transport system permease protein